MNAASKIIILILVGLLLLTIIYARVQRVKALANLVLAEENREEAEKQRKVINETRILLEYRKQEADLAREQAERVKRDCEEQLAELQRKKR